MPIVYDDDKPAAAAPRAIHYDDDVIKDVKAGAKKPSPKSDGPDWSKFPPLGVAEEVMHMGSGMLAKPAGDLAALSSIVRGRPDPRADQRAVREGLTYEPRTDAGKAAVKYNPLALIAKLWGAGAHGIGRMAGEGDPNSSARNAFGSGVEETVNQLPNLIGAEGAGAGARAATSGARSLVKSALKPDKFARESKLPVTGKSRSDSAVDTILENQINVSESGANKLREMRDGLNDRIDKMVEGSPATVDKKQVAAYLHDSVNKFEKQVNPLDDLAAIQKAWDEFLAVQPDKIPVKQAQALKRGTYRVLGDKAYGGEKQSPATVDAQKTLARGLKEEIATQLPQVRTLSAEESKVLNALSLVEKRAALEANKNPMGLALVTTSPTKWAAFMADRSSAFKSIIAHMLNAGAKAAPATLPPLGMAITSQASQLPPPPPQQPGASPGA